MKRALVALVLVAGCGVSPAEEARREFEQGKACFKREDHREALKHFDRSIAILPTADAYAERAASNFILDNHLPAVSDGGEALKLDPKHKRATELMKIFTESAERRAKN